MKVFRNISLHLLSIPVPLLLIWAVVILSQHPSVGFFWDSRKGIVYEVDLMHPSSEKVRRGDRVLSIDNLNSTYANQLNEKKAGDVIHFEIVRDGVHLNIPVEFAAPDFGLVLERIAPLIVALAFLLAGNIVLAFSHSENLSTLFILLSLGVAVSASSAAMSAIGLSWARSVFLVALFWTGAFTVHLHLFFPLPVTNRYGEITGFLLAGLSITLALIYLLGSIFQPGTLQDNLFRRIPLPILGLDFSAVIFTLVFSYRRSKSAIERHRAGLIVFSGLVGILPLLTLSLIPQLIIGYPFVSYNVSFVCLLFLPIGYSYAILHYRMIGINKTVNRGAAYILILVSIAGMYSIWYALSFRFISPSITNSPIWMVGTSILLVILTFKFHPVCSKFLNKVLYGGWYDYRSVIDSVSLSLNSAEIDNMATGAAICQVIGKSMRLEFVELILNDQIAFSFEENQPIRSKRIDTGKTKQIMARLDTLKIEGEMFISPKSNLGLELFAEITGREKQAQYLIPLHGKGKQTLGVLVLGRKCDGENLDTEDLGILKVVVQQAQMTLENVRLLEKVQEHSEMIGKLHRQVIRAREEERKRVARDLHDLIIQSLVGINYMISGMKSNLKNLDEDDLISTQSEIRYLIKELRQICSDLRPTSLDVLGLTAAVQSSAEEVEKNAPFKIRLVAEGNEDQDIPEEIKVSVYRFVQESLLNVQKHAQADLVELRMQITSDMITVSVTDNGKGFLVPDHLGDFTQEKHFGLVGMKELIESVNGNLQVASKPGEGCVLKVQVPI